MQIVNPVEIQKIIDLHSNTAKHFYLSAGNLNVLRVQDLQLWLTHASNIAKLTSIVMQASKPGISKKRFSALSKELKTFRKTAGYMKSFDVQDGQLSVEYAAWELLAFQRVKVDQLDGDTQVVPSLYLLPAFENRDYFQFELHYDLDKYGLDYWKLVDIGLYYFILENMDLPESYQPDETLIPLAVFDDALRIAQRVAVEHFMFAHHAAKQPVVLPSLMGDADDSIDAYADYWISKYPVLRGLTVDQFQRHLLDSYTMLQSGIVKEFGPNELCIPFDNGKFNRLTSRGISSNN